MKFQNNEPLEEKVVSISRVAKVVKGGRRFGFSALVVVGDKNGHVGFGVGKAAEVPDALKKGSEQAKKNMLSVPILCGTVPFEVVGHYGPTRVIINPAPKGKGIIAGGAVRILMELSGLKDVVCKIYGSKNPHNVVRATADGILQLVDIPSYAKQRGKTIEEIVKSKRLKNLLKESGLIS